MEVLEAKDQVLVNLLISGAEEVGFEPKILSDFHSQLRNPLARYLHPLSGNFLVRRGGDNRHTIPQPGWV